VVNGGKLTKNSLLNLLGGIPNNLN
jgi:hypothetical protein